MRLPLLAWDLLAVFSRRRPIAPPAASICVFVGSDWTSLIRGLLVAWHIQAKHRSVYVVDDIFELSLRRTGACRPLALRLTRWLLQRFDQHFAITAGLATKMSLQCAAHWKALDLPYDFEVPLIAGALSSSQLEQESEAQPKVLLFLGALTPYVTPMLSRVIQLMVSSDHQSSPLELHVISQRVPDDFLRKHADAVRAGVLKIHMAMSDADLISDYQGRGIFICPYSDLPEHRSFVSCSFPSKILKMIQSGLPCVIVAPAYAAVSQSHGVGIPSVHIEGDLAPLDATIAAMQSCLTMPSPMIQAKHDPTRFLLTTCH